MQQQANAQQPAYHPQQMPAQMPQYQTQPTYQSQPQYVMSQAQPPPPQMQDRPRQGVPNEQQMAQNIYGQQQMMPVLPQNVLYHQQQIQNHYSLQPNMIRSPATNQQVMPGLPGQMHPQAQANIYSQNNAAAIMSGAATLRRPPSNQTREAMEQNPNANMPDNLIYDRDKQQIFKYSTLRQGGKFDPRNFGPRPSIPNGAQQGAGVPPKPSILNCPLPEIPKENAPTNGKDPINATSPRNFTTNGAPNANQPAMTR